MIRQKSYADHPASLYLVPTPIGNLQEISERTLEILKQADVIACEDTRNTGKLLSMLQIKKPLISHHEHNQQASIPKILALLQEGKSVAVLSDAGYPLISDPGANLVKSVIEQEIPVICISGPNAALNALAASGLDCSHYLFYGFLSNKSSVRIKELNTLKTLPYTLIFYEAPHRIAAMLADVLEVLGDRQMCLAREISKLHEEYLRGSVQEVLQAASEGLKGEMVVVVSGASDTPQTDMEGAVQAVFEKMEAGMKMKQAVKESAVASGINKNALYEQVLLKKKESESV